MDIVRHAVFASVAAMLAGSALPASAGDCVEPCIGYALSIQLEDDWIAAATPSNLKSNQLYPTIDAAAALSVTHNMQLVTAVTIEPVLDPPPGESAAFSDIGAYVEQIYAQFEAGPMVLQLGKLDPVFGLATNELEGIQATDLVGDYDTDERWAAQAFLNYEMADFAHTITASLFTTDRGILSESLFTNRGRTTLADGGAGNTTGVSSLALLLDGCKGAATPVCYEEGEFGYRLAFRFQRAGRASPEEIEEGIRPADEVGALAATTANFSLSDATLRLLGEAAYFRHFDAAPDDAIAITIAAEIDTDPMIYMASYSLQRNLIEDEPETTERLLDLTVMYGLDESTSVVGEQWLLGAGYSFADDGEGEKAHTFSLQLTLDIEGTLVGAEMSDED